MTDRRAVIHTAPSYRELMAWLAEHVPAGQPFLLLAHSRAAADEFLWSCAKGMSGAHRRTLSQAAAEMAAPALAEAGYSAPSRLAAEALVSKILAELVEDGLLGYFAGIADTPGFPRAALATLDELRMGGIETEDLKRHGPGPRNLASLLLRYEAGLREERIADQAAAFSAACDAASQPWSGLPLLLLDVPVRDLLSQRLLSRMARESPAVAAAVLSQDDESRRALERVLAVPAVMPPGPPAEPERSYFSAAGEGAECVEIARRIRALAEGGVPFDALAVLLRQPVRYQPLVEEAFRRAGIPGYFTRGVVRPDPAGRAFLALLYCAQEGLSATRFAEYLSLAEAPVAPQGWEQLIVDAAVIGGADRWERRLAGLEAELETQLSGMDEEASRQALERRLERLRELSEYALPLIRRLAALPRAAVWGDWISALTDLAGEAIREPVAVAAVLEELHPMATLGPVGLAGVLRVLADRLTNLRLEPPARRFGRVFVGSVEDARGMQFHTVFLPGLAEGLFPRRVTEDPLLLDDVREQLPGLVRNRTRAERERLLLQIATGAGTRLDVSYPRMDSAQSRPRVPSFYALEVARLAEGHFPRLDEFRQKARGAADARLGWPAPSRPEQAIDDAEYDLAVLAGERVRGMARYMVEANPALGRSLRIRWNRWEKRNWNDADGLIGPVPALARHQLAARPYSATALQRFAVCPYQFLLHSIHRLQEREVPSAIERLDALTRGVLFHEVLRRFLDAQDPDADLAEALDLADRTLDSVAETFAEDLAPAIPRVWQSEMEDIRGDVRGWLREMSRERAWQPVSWEQEFDADLDGRARLSGRIDLLERHTVTSVLRITDHKTGKPPAERPAFLGQGELMQPLLYAMAAEKSLGATVSGGRLFYCTQRGEYQEAFVPLSETARAHAAEALEIIGQATRDGSFPAAPRAGACAVCPYRAVCGPYEEERARKKNPAGLESLARLRSIP